MDRLLLKMGKGIRIASQNRSSLSIFDCIGYDAASCRRSIDGMLVSAIR